MLADVGLKARFVTNGGKNVDPPPGAADMVVITLHADDNTASGTPRPGTLLGTFSYVGRADPLTIIPPIASNKQLHVFELVGGPLTLAASTTYWLQAAKTATATLSPIPHYFDWTVTDPIIGGTGSGPGSIGQPLSSEFITADNWVQPGNGRVLQFCVHSCGSVTTTDTDGDGVDDADDDCPGTASGASVDANGCSDAQLDDDNDGVSNADDLCPGTVIPEESVPTVELKPNHWALVTDDGDFDTVSKGKGNGPGRSYTIEDTAGCSGEQIIAEQGLGKGHSKHGLSISAMDGWVALVNP